MNNSMISAMVSLGGTQQRLDLLADNLANANTAGYKSKQATFEETLTAVKKQGDKFKLDGRATPMGFQMGFGSKLSYISQNNKQGNLIETGNKTDIAIQGNALFKVSLSEDGPTAYTRGGDFHLQPNPENEEEAYLVNGQGYFVLNEENQRITVPANGEFNIDPNGNITALQGDEVVGLGAINVSVVIRPDALERRDNGLYVIASGGQGEEGEQAVLQNNSTIDPQSSQRAKLQQGVIENSNVDISGTMAELIQVQRTYQLAARALTSSDNMMNLANNLRG
ncbi:flagellar hook-basal body protein [Paenibacillus turicensis]|uniref:flagellar hook-basal body protein n=1 Tax=Paenibacillus turicensis TaxID=160487 RepID=UPI003D2C9D23